MDNNDPIRPAPKRQYVRRAVWDHGMTQHTEEAYADLLRAAKAVCWFDWSDNDPDAVAAIETLRAAIALAEDRKKPERPRDEIQPNSYPHNITLPMYDD